MRASALPPGRHEVRLTYREPAIGTGLALSAIAWLGFLVVLLIVVLRTRRSRDRTGQQNPAQDDGSVETVSAGS